MYLIEKLHLIGQLVPTTSFFEFPNSFTLGAEKLPQMIELKS